MAVWFRSIVFTLLIPGTIAGYMPYWLIKNTKPDMHLGVLHWVGIMFICLGILFYIWTVISFLLKGKGTPAIWFTAVLSFIIGKEPTKMVSSGLYKYSRNPMYLGIMSIVAGSGIFFQFSILLWYALILFIIFSGVVIWIEEPHLEKKFGNAYQSYKKETRRWL